MILSKRLEAVAAMVKPGLVVADVGTDHAFIPVELVRRGIAPRAIAMDVREGPLSRARDHIHAAGLDEKIETRLSDGLAGLSPGEAQCAVIAGMGGPLMEHILSASPDTVRSLQELVLQPQSRVSDFRRYLDEKGYRLLAEDMILEEGKYYPMMKVTLQGFSGYSEGMHSDNMASSNLEEMPSDNMASSDCEGSVQYKLGNRVKPYSGSLRTLEKDLSYAYGPLLLSHAHPVLKMYLEREKSILEKILFQLESAGNSKDEKNGQRRRKIEQQLYLNEKARKYYYMK